MKPKPLNRGTAPWMAHQFTTTEGKEMLKTIIDVHKDSLGDCEWGIQVIHHTKRQVVIHDWDSDGETQSVTVNMNHVDRLIAALQAIKALDT
jgi:hypothetical protein